MNALHVLSHDCMLDMTLIIILGSWLHDLSESAIESQHSAYTSVMSEPTVHRMLCEGPVQFTFGQQVSIKCSCIVLVYHDQTS